MKTGTRVFFTVALLLGLGAVLPGCYRRTTAPMYESDASEVLRIREQLGVVTAEKTYENLEEESEDE